MLYSQDFKHTRCVSEGNILLSTEALGKMIKNNVLVFPLIITVYNRSASNETGATLSWTPYKHCEAAYSFLFCISLSAENELVSASVQSIEPFIFIKK